MKKMFVAITLFSPFFVAPLHAMHPQQEDDASRQSERSAEHGGYGRPYLPAAFHQPVPQQHRAGLPPHAPRPAQAARQHKAVPGGMHAPQQNRTVLQEQPAHRNPSPIRRQPSPLDAAIAECARIARLTPPSSDEAPLRFISPQRAAQQRAGEAVDTAEQRRYGTPTRQLRMQPTVHPLPVRQVTERRGDTPHPHYKAQQQTMTAEHHYNGSGQLYRNNHQETTGHQQTAQLRTASPDRRGAPQPDARKEAFLAKGTDAYIERLDERTQRYALGLKDMFAKLRGCHKEGEFIGLAIAFNTVTGPNRHHILKIMQPEARQPETMAILEELQIRIARMDNQLIHAANRHHAKEAREAAEKEEQSTERRRRRRSHVKRSRSASVGDEIDAEDLTSVCKALYKSTKTTKEIVAALQEPITATAAKVQELHQHHGHSTSTLVATSAASAALAVIICRVMSNRA